VAEEQGSPITVFYSYAEEDAAWRERLAKHLSQLKRDGIITEAYDQMVLAGSDRAQALDNNITAAHIIILLISADFLASDVCYQEEMQRALERHRRGEACMIPIIVSPCDWRHSPFANLQCLPRDKKPVTQWPDPNAAMQHIVEELRLVIDTFKKQPAPADPADAQPRIIDRLPYERNPFFTGRGEILDRLHASLHAQNTTAISGLGGIGKTQTAIEYAYRYQQDYDHIFWMRANSQDTLTLDFLATAQRLQLPEQNEPARIIAAVKDWLNKHQRWLLILDNADDLSFVKPFLPLQAPGHILLTTRAQAMRTLSITNPIELNTMSEQEAVLFLLRRAGLLPTTAPVTDASQDDQHDASTLVKTLGCLPLALDQAGAYLEETGASIAEYLDLYQQHRTAFLGRRGRLKVDHKPVATTWSVAFDRLKELNPAVLELIRLCAFLASDAIPEEVFTEEKLNLSPALHEFTTNRLALNEALADLRNYGLISRDPASRTISMHRLVQAVIQDVMNEKQQKLWATRAIKAINTLFPFGEPGPWLQSQRVFPHALTCLEHREQWDMTFFEARDLLTRVGVYLENRGQYSEAEPLKLEALAISRKVLGDEHNDTASALNNLAILYWYQGKYEQAEPLYQQALAISRKVLGDEHPDTAIDLNNLAILYRKQGKFEQAESLCLKALAIRKKLLGEEHLDTARSLHNLAYICFSQGQFQQAEPLLQQTLAIYRKVLGNEHPETAQSLNDLANIYVNQQDKFEQAEPLYQEALAIREKVLGDDHPDTAQGLHSLAVFYGRQDQYEQAELLYQEALAIYKKVLGDEHPDVALALNNLATLYTDQGKFEQAEPLYQQALAIRQKMLGDDHPDTKATMKRYAELQQEMQKRKDE
jgi:tetratricopeptide (TPR) repeat protein